MLTSTTLWGVFLGGCLGTALRAGIGVALAAAQPTPAPTGAWATTLTVNVVGAVLLGLLMARVRGRPMTPDWIQPTIAIGVLGSFTTYSALAVDATDLGRTLGVTFLIGFPLLNLLLGLTGVRVGLWLGRARPRAAGDAPC